MDDSELVSRLSCAVDDEEIAAGLVEHLLIFVFDEYRVVLAFRLIGSNESLLSSTIQNTIKLKYLLKNIFN